MKFLPSQDASYARRLNDIFRKSIAVKDLRFLLHQERRALLYYLKMYLKDFSGSLEVESLLREYLSLLQSPLLYPDVELFCFHHVPQEVYRDRGLINFLIVGYDILYSTIFRRFRGANRRVLYRIFKLCLFRIFWCKAESYFRKFYLEISYSHILCKIGKTYFSLNFPQLYTRLHLNNLLLFPVLPEDAPLSVASSSEPLSSTEFFEPRFSDVGDQILPSRINAGLFQAWGAFRKIALEVLLKNAQISLDPLAEHMMSALYHTIYPEKDDVQCFFEQILWPYLSSYPLCNIYSYADHCLALFPAIENLLGLIDEKAEWGDKLSKLHKQYQDWARLCKKKSPMTATFQGRSYYYPHLYDGIQSPIYADPFLGVPDIMWAWLINYLVQFRTENEIFKDIIWEPDETFQTFIFRLGQLRIDQLEDKDRQKLQIVLSRLFIALFIKKSSLKSVKDKVYMGHEYHRNCFLRHIRETDLDLSNRGEDFQRLLFAISHIDYGKGFNATYNAIHQEGPLFKQKYRDKVLHRYTDQDYENAEREYFCKEGLEPFGTVEKHLSLCENPQVDGMSLESIFYTFLTLWIEKSEYPKIDDDILKNWSCGNWGNLLMMILNYSKNNNSLSFSSTQISEYIYFLFYATLSSHNYKYSHFCPLDNLEAPRRRSLSIKSLGKDMVEKFLKIKMFSNQRVLEQVMEESSSNEKKEMDEEPTQIQFPQSDPFGYDFPPPLDIKTEGASSVFLDDKNEKRESHRALGHRPLKSRRQTLVIDLKHRVFTRASPLQEYGESSPNSTFSGAHSSPTRERGDYTLTSRRESLKNELKGKIQQKFHDLLPPRIGIRLSEKQKIGAYA